MKRYSISVILHLILLVLLGIGGYWLFEHRLWFSVFVTILTLGAVGIHLYWLQMRQIHMMRRLINSIRFNDMTQTFHPPFKDKMMAGLAEELSLSLKCFRERLLEEEIKHQYYENLLNRVDTAVFVVDKSGQVEWRNQAAIVLLGQRSHLPDEILKAPVNETRVIRIRQSGTVIEMAASATLFVTQNKERLLISLKNIHSVLERNEMEAWQKLIRVLTHEIMNSITPIISLSETLSERMVTRESNENEYGIMLQAMQTIYRRSKGLLEFVENYRRLTRIPVPVCIPVSVNELFSDLKNLFPECYICFEQKVPDDFLTADRTQVEQILINLIKNAKEACSRKKDPQIDVKFNIMRENGNRMLTVSDNGEGILPEVLDKIFVPFFTTKSSGSGIGLSLCKQIMNLHGGVIDVHSEKGKGSRFTLEFPG